MDFTSLYWVDGKVSALLGGGFLAWATCLGSYHLHLLYTACLPAPLYTTAFLGSACLHPLIWDSAVLGSKWGVLGGCYTLSLGRICTMPCIHRTPYTGDTWGSA